MDILKAIEQITEAPLCEEFTWGAKCLVCDRFHTTREMPDPWDPEKWFLDPEHHEEDCAWVALKQIITRLTPGQEMKVLLATLTGEEIVDWKNNIVAFMEGWSPEEKADALQELAKNEQI